MMSFWRAASLIVLSCGAPFATGASAEPRRWTVHLGIIATRLADKTEIDIAGTRDPKAAASTRVSTEPTIDVIWHLNETFAAAFSGGMPPVTTVMGEGSLEPLGVLLRSRAGATTASVQVRRPFGPVHPYAGIGAAYLHVFRTKGVAVQDARASHDLGPMIQVGMEVRLRPRIGVFAEVKKAWLASRLTGSVGGTPTESRMHLDPLTVTTGLSVSFR